MKTKEEIKNQLWEMFLLALCDTMIEKNQDYQVVIKLLVKPETSRDLMQIVGWMSELIEEHNNEHQIDGD